MMKLILRPDIEQAQLVTAEIAAHHDLTGATMIDVADDFTFIGKAVDWDTLTVGDDLAGAKRDAFRAVSAHFAAVLGMGCVTPKGQADCDDKAQSRVTGAVFMLEKLIASGAADPVVNWTMFDGSVVEHHHPDMVALGIAIGLHMQACFSRKQELETAITATASIAELSDISITTGWPE